MTNPASPPLAPVSISSHQGSPSKIPSLLSPSSPKVSSSSASVESPVKEISASDKEREKLLYPGRVLLTSKSLQSVRVIFGENPSLSLIVVHITQFFPLKTLLCTRFLP